MPFDTQSNIRRAYSITFQQNPHVLAWPYRDHSGGCFLSHGRCLALAEKPTITLNISKGSRSRCRDPIHLVQSSVVTILCLTLEMAFVRIAALAIYGAYATATVRAITLSNVVTSGRANKLLVMNTTSIQNTCCSPTPGGLIPQAQFWDTYTGLGYDGQLLPKKAGRFTVSGLTIAMGRRGTKNLSAGWAHSQQHKAFSQVF